MFLFIHLPVISDLFDKTISDIDSTSNNTTRWIVTTATALHSFIIITCHDIPAYAIHRADGTIIDSELQTSYDGRQRQWKHIEYYE